MFSKKRGLTALALLSISVLLLSSCGGATPAGGGATPAGGGTTPSAGQPTAPPKGKPVIIGGVFNQTGWMATYDDPPRHGARAAVQMLNEKGGILGRPVQLLEIDGKTDPAVVANSTIQLMQQGAEFIISPCDFDIGAPASIEAQKAGLASMSTCASSPLFNETVIGNLAFTLSEGSHGIGAVAAEMAWEFGWRRAYIITDSGWEYTRSLGKAFGYSWKRLGGEVVGEDSYQPGDTDFSSQIARVKQLAKPPDVIMVACVMPEGAVIMRQFRLAGVDVPLIADDGIDDPEIVPAIGPENIRNIWYVTHAWYTPEAGPEYPEYIRYYKQVWDEKTPNTGLAAMGWDVVTLFARAAERAGTTNGKAVAAQLEKMNKEPVLSGYVTWTPEDHVPTKPMVAIKVEGDTFTFLKWIEPPFMPPRSDYTQ